MQNTIKLFFELTKCVTQKVLDISLLGHTVLGKPYYNYILCDPEGFGHIAS